MIEDDFSPMSEGTVGMSFLEKLVLAIIDAHPLKDKNDSRSRDLRLREAMNALAPPYYRVETNYKDDRQILLWMAAQEIAIKKEYMIMRGAKSPFIEAVEPINFKNIRDLAGIAIDHFQISGISRKHIKDRLAKKYTELSDKLKEEILNASAIPHVVEHNLLLKIAEIAKQADLDMKLPVRPKAFF